MRLFKKLRFIVPLFLVSCTTQINTTSPNVVSSPVNTLKIDDIERGKVANVLIWEAISPNGKNKSYLLGTIHLPLDSRYTIPEKVTNAIKASNKFYMEADTDISALDSSVISSGFNINQDLEKELSPDIWAKLVDRMKSYPGMSANVIKVSEPWLIKIVLSSVDSDKNASVKEALDNIIRTKAEELKVPVNFLETAKDQITTLQNSKTRDEHIEDIKRILFTTTLNTFSDSRQKLLTDYNKADISAILKTDELEDKDSKEYKSILVDRENNWYKKIDFENDNVFVAVGTLHVIRNNGIIDTLKAKGFKITML